MENENGILTTILMGIIGAIGLSQWLPKLMPKLFAGWAKDKHDRREHSQAIETRLLEQFMLDRQEDGAWQKKTLVGLLIDLEKKLDEISTYQYQLDRDQTAMLVEIRNQLSNDMRTVESTLIQIVQSVLGLYDLVDESTANIKAEKEAMTRELQRVRGKRRRHQPIVDPDELLNSASKVEARNPKIDTGEFRIYNIDSDRNNPS